MRRTRVVLRLCLLSDLQPRCVSQATVEPCPQKDFRKIEHLWPEQHFRGPLNGPQSYFKRVPPHFLAYHTNYSVCGRKVYIDVGAKSFLHGGMMDFFKLYPPIAEFDEFYAFEITPGEYKMPAPRDLERILRGKMSPERITKFTQRHFFFQVSTETRSMSFPA